MPRWKSLPEELDPQVGEFTGQLRRLVDRSGLSLAALADRTGYSKTSWERYLHGRLLPPQGAVVALAEATGAHPGHLTTLWELAERAWSRAEMRQDVTMEAIRVAQARAALGEFEVRPAEAKPSTKTGKLKKSEKSEKAEKFDRPEKPEKSGKSEESEKVARASEGVQVAVAESPQAARMHQVPQVPQMPRMPSVPQQRSGEMPSPKDFPEWAAPAPTPAPPPAPAPAPKGEDRRVSRRRMAMYAVGAVGALLVGLAAGLLLHPATGSAKKAAAAKPSAAAPSAQPVLPAGVRCSGPSCAGKDPEAMGCGGQRATSSSRGTAGGAVIEVRYSAVCRAAWARISGAAAGDQAIISSGGQSRTARVERHGDAYTAMVEVPGDPAKVSACGTTMAGAKGCARPTSTTAAGPAAEPAR